MIVAVAAAPSYAHLKRLTTNVGLYEHANLDEPRPEHGYCVDDVSRALILLCREPDLNSQTHAMLDLYLNFTLSAISSNGACHNRMNVDGFWTDQPGKGDWWGRALWALGIAAVHAPKEEQRSRALIGFRLLAQTTSPDLMAISFAALGAAELLLSRPKEFSAQKVVVDAQARLTQPRRDSDWLWPEPRLRYSNASLAEAVMLIGLALHDPTIIEQGVLMLDFLVGTETRLGRFSVTPVGGRGPGETGVGYDQQPIELAAIADACARAWTITGNRKWLDELRRAWSWFLGNNDGEVPMFDPKTGAGYDGLHARGPNRNQGAESTLAMLSTAQAAFRHNVIS